MIKKSQVTVFVILGLILLIAVGIIIYVVGQVNQEKPENIPKEIEPVKQYVEECLYNTAKEGINLLGANGGYIKPEEAGLYSIPNMPTSSNSIEFAPDSGYYIPYWYYMASSNTCTNCYFSSKRPGLKSAQGSLSMESQLTSYIEENLAKCLDFTAFQGKFIITKKGEPEADVQIGDNNVLLSLNMPLNVKYKGVDSVITKYNSNLNVNLNAMYALAENIINMEVDYNTYSRLTTELIAIYSSGYNPALAPMNGPTEMDFSSPRYWMLPDVKTALEGVLAQNIPVVKIEGTKQSILYASDNAWTTGIYSNFLLGLNDVDPNTLSKLKVNFVYLDWWPIYLDVTPRRGTLIWPESLLNTFIIPFSITRYTFGYDVSYPILVTITDDSALKGEGFTLQYAMEINIRNNEAVAGELPTIDQGPGETSLFPEQLKTKEIKVKTKNALSNSALEDVMVLYSCVDETAYIGMSKAFGTEASLTSKFPTCTGGLLILKKDGFIDKTVALDLAEDEELELEYGLDPILSKKMVVKKKIIRKEYTGLTSNWKLASGVVQDLNPDDEVIVMLERQKITPEDTEFVKYYNLKDTNQAEIELTSGKFKVEAYLIRHFGEGYSMPQFVIPAREFCYDKEPLNPFGGDECQTIPAVEFKESIYLGGVLFDETTGFFEIKTTDLNKATITIFVASNSLTDFTQVEDLGQLDKVASYSVAYRNELLPVFS